MRLPQDQIDKVLSKIGWATANLKKDNQPCHRGNFTPGEKPQEPGHYWAASRNYKWWNLIVYISGEAPYLSVDVFHSRYGKAAQESDIDLWGPKIEEPVTPKRWREYLKEISDGK